MEENMYAYTRIFCKPTKTFLSDASGGCPAVVCVVFADTHIVKRKTFTAMSADSLNHLMLILIHLLLLGKLLWVSVGHSVSCILPSNDNLVYWCISGLDNLEY